MADDEQVIQLRDGSIRLGQLLKLANLVEDGLDAKLVIGQGDVSVNGEVETRRGRQLLPGDHITYQSPATLHRVRLTAGSADPVAP